MNVLKLTDFSSTEFECSLEIYKSSFPSNETRPIERVVEMLKRDKNYQLFIYLKDNSVVGISLMYIFRSLGIGLLDYMAVKSNYQRQGLGREIFEGTFKKFASDIHDGIGLVIEIQRENAPNLQEREINVRKNRIRFYVRMGAKILERVNYFLPPIQYGTEPEEMYLMIKPLDEIHYLPKESVLQYIEAIYSTIYQYQAKDLLDTISQQLPSKIILSDMVVI
jgi:GNAT superfamily N-acetyltransferase